MSFFRIGEFLDTQSKIIRGKSASKVNKSWRVIQRNEKSKNKNVLFMQTYYFKCNEFDKIL